MIQLLALREYTKRDGGKATAERFFEKGYRADSVKDLFANIDTYLSQIPEDEHWNFYYTASRCLEQKGRILDTQDILPIDIDNINVTEVEEYIDIVLDTLNIKREDTGIVFTGNGLQFIIGLNTPITSTKYFDDNRLFYRGLCGKINHALYFAGKTGDADTSVFSAARLLRLPNTLNIKKKKGTKNAKLIQPTINHIDFNLVEVSGVPLIEAAQQVSKEFIRKTAPDTNAVLEGCEFLKWCKDNQDEVTEPQWYAMMSILGVLDNGLELAHEYSREASTYTEHETERKFHQAVEASGPRFCANIATLWDKCPSCPFCGQCTTPVTIKSAEHIDTLMTGFWITEMTADGTPKNVRPDYDGLMKYFNQQHPFVSTEEGKLTYTWTDTHWQECPVNRIKAFAENHFLPKPVENQRVEFHNKLACNNQRPVKWFNSPHGFINFANGVLDLEAMAVDDHSINKGFQYVLPFNYDPTATCERFDKFLDEITCSDDSLKAVLCEFMGYALSGIDASIGQKALILAGDGANGKSVFMDVLKHLAGEGNYSSLSMGNEINKLENRHQLAGKLFNVSEETPTNAMMDNSVFKALVTGGEVQARKLYCDAYPMKNDAKIIMACNELPATADKTYGMFRRLLIIPFNASFIGQAEDKHLRGKLYAEAAGIYNRAIEGLLRFKRNDGFTQSETIENTITQYKSDNDDVSQWFDDRIIYEEGAYVSTSKLHMMYKTEQEMQGIRPMSTVWFGRAMRNKGVDSKTRRIEGKNQRVYLGIRLATKGDDDEI